MTCIKVLKEELALVIDKWPWFIAKYTELITKVHNMYVYVDLTFLPSNVAGVEFDIIPTELLALQKYPPVSLYIVDGMLYSLLVSPTNKMSSSVSVLMYHW